MMAVVLLLQGYGFHNMLGTLCYPYTGRLLGERTTPLTVLNKLKEASESK